MSHPIVGQHRLRLLPLTEARAFLVLSIEPEGSDVFRFRLCYCPRQSFECKRIESLVFYLHKHMPASFGHVTKADLPYKSGALICCVQSATQMALGARVSMKQGPRGLVPFLLVRH